MRTIENLDKDRLQKSRTPLKPQDNSQIVFKNWTYTPAFTIDFVRVYLEQNQNKSS